MTKKGKGQFSSNSSGMSLIETLIAVGLIGLLIYGATSFIQQIASSVQNLKLRGQQVDIKNNIRQQFDCNATLDQVAAQCKGKSFADKKFVSLYKRDGSVLISEAHERFSQGFDLRASCAEVGSLTEFKVDIQRTDSSGRPIKDFRLDLEPGWRDFYDGIPLACSHTKCDPAIEKTHVVRLDFPSTVGAECRWGLDGNLTRSLGSNARAVAEQRVSFSLPDPNGRICSIAFNGGSRYIRYDDFLFFTFNGFILASAQYTERNFLNMGMTQVGALIRYDKSKHMGKRPYGPGMNSTRNAICPKFGRCTIVQSQRVGPIYINAPSKWFALLPAAILAQPVHSFSAWVTGQGHDTDCQHTGMSFELSIKYLD